MKCFNNYNDGNEIFQQLQRLKWDISTIRTLKIGYFKHYNAWNKMFQQL